MLNVVFLHYEHPTESHMVKYLAVLFLVLENDSSQ